MKNLLLSVCVIVFYSVLYCCVDMCVCGCLSSVGVMLVCVSSGLVVMLCCVVSVMLYVMRLIVMVFLFFCFIGVVGVVKMFSVNE